MAKQKPEPTPTPESGGVTTMVAPHIHVGPDRRCAECGLDLSHDIHAVKNADFPQANGEAKPDHVVPAAQAAPPPAKPKNKVRPMSDTLRSLAKVDRDFQDIPVEHRDLALRYLNAEYGPVAQSDDLEIPFP